MQPGDGGGHWGQRELSVAAKAAAAQMGVVTMAGQMVEQGTLKKVILLQCEIELLVYTQMARLTLLRSEEHTSELQSH